LAWNRIAEILALSPHTVRDYVQDIYRRAGGERLRKAGQQAGERKRRQPFSKRPDDLTATTAVECLPAAAA
jgi:hypothetical protein